MGENTKIEWTATYLPDGTVIPGHTFNPWLGCTKVSDGCKFCYAEQMMDKRWGKVEWGPQGKRMKTSDANWRKPHTWNRKAEQEGVRYRVFCGSLCDVFEDRTGIDALGYWRAQLWTLITKTPHLDWLLLTKRPENALRMLPKHWRPLPDNIWIGTSVEDQKTADQRIPELLKIPAAIRFLSCEPLLNQVNISRYFERKWRREFANVTAYGEMREYEAQAGVNWVIVGGESGPGARPFSLAWARLIVDHCQRADVPVFIKQLGSNPYDGWLGFEKAYVTSDRKGGNIDEFPEELQVREFPQLELA